MEDRATLAATAFKASANYEEARPTYTVESVKFLLEKLEILEEKENEKSNFTRKQPLTVLELGCGTGKFTRVLMEVLEGIEARVIASDPLDTMLEQFRKILPNVELQQYSAENVGRFVLCPRVSIKLNCRTVALIDCLLCCLYCFVLVEQRPACIIQYGGYSNTEILPI